MWSLTKLRTIELNETEMIFDSIFHPRLHNIVALGTIEGDIIMIDIDNDTAPITFRFRKHHKGSAIRKLDFTPNGNLVSAARSIKIFDLDKGFVVRSIQNSSCKISSLIVVDNFLLCTGDDEGKFRLWDYRVDRGVAMEIDVSEESISDFDIGPNKRIVLATTEDGMLSAINIRAKRLEEPQSEKFDAGFQCVRYFNEKNTVLVGAEDGAINIFNFGEWGTISDRFPVRKKSKRKEMVCSIDSLELIKDTYAIAAMSNGHVKLLSFYPHKIIAEGNKHNGSVESLAVCNVTDKIATSDSNFIFIHQMKEIEYTKDNVPINNFFADL